MTWLRRSMMRDLWLVCFITLVCGACGMPLPGSGSKDIFQEDANPDRRHPATDDEVLWTVYMGGCTGHLLSPDYMMTAAHCTPSAGARYMTGAAMRSSRNYDIMVEQVVENGQAYSLDYAILKIRWLSTRPQNQKFPPLLATKSSDVATSQSPNQGDAVFTVGFPSDQQAATYSEGQLKGVSGSELVYDMGIINGNSGGGVWLKKSNMLVALTNGGPHAFNQPGWNTSSKNDSNAWNHGVAMWSVYRVSNVLQDIFPNGRNRFGGTQAGGDGGGIAENGLYAAIGEGSNGYLLQAAYKERVANMVACDGDQDKCASNSPGYRRGSYVRQEGNAAIYSLSSSYQVSEGKTLTIMALDNNNEVLAKRVLRFSKNDGNFNLGAELSTDPQAAQLAPLLRDWASKASSIASYGTYGGNSGAVPYLRVSTAVSSGENLPKVLITAATHGDERISTTTVLGVLNRLISRYGSDAEVRRLVSTRDIYVVPAVCMDGYAANSREVEGQDPNRSFPEINASGSGRTGCARAMESFFASQRFVATIDYHASGRMVMYPWSAKTSPIEDTYEAGQYRVLAKKMADTLGNGYRWGQIPSMVGYTAPGSSGDYFHWRSRQLGFKTAAFGVEVGLAKDARDPNAVREEIDGNFRSLKIFIDEGPTLFTNSYALARVPVEVPDAPAYHSLPQGFMPGLE